MNKKIINQDSIDQSNKRALDNNPSSVILGVANDKLIEPVPNFIEAPCEKIIKGENNTFITLGRDRPSNLLSGYGGIGSTNAGTIDIVAGRMSGKIKTETIKGAKIIPIYCDNNFTKDASRIYISQKTDIDKNFNIVKTKSGTTEAKAAIAIKSDHVRLIGRESIKLVTGTDKKNSRGEEIMSIPGIELIAGNNEEGLQPIPKGKNLLSALRSINDQIDRLSGIVDSFLTYQLEFNAVLMQHTHPDPLTMFVGIMSSGNPLEITGGRDLPSPEVFESGIKSTTSLLTITKKDLITLKTNLANLQLNYLEQFGKEFINSRSNKTN